MVLGMRGCPLHGMPFDATQYDGPIDFCGSLDEIVSEIERRVTVTPADGGDRRLSIEQVE
jgi:two-component system, chemotaxis family, protein-glutamate methylesterase/glutaminase